LNIQSNLSGKESRIEQIINFAERLGYSGIAVCDNFQGLEKLNELKNEIDKFKTDLEVHLGVKIQAKDVNELKEALSKVREKVMIVAVSGGDYTINRTACEDSRVDILFHPEAGRFDNGLDEPSLQSATQNNVAIEINFREILNSFRKPRSYTLNHIEQNIVLCNRFKTPMIICSGAESIWDMRAPRDLISIANVLGMDIGKAFLSMSSVPLEIINGNKKTLEGTKITDGVEVVE
jgi:ribonuclease P/MRP protein subunit RPP1